MWEKQEKNISLSLCLNSAFTSCNCWRSPDLLQAQTSIMKAPTAVKAPSYGPLFCTARWRQWQIPALQVVSFARRQLVSKAIHRLLQHVTCIWGTSCYWPAVIDLCSSKLQPEMILLQASACSPCFHPLPKVYKGLHGLKYQPLKKGILQYSIIFLVNGCLQLKFKGLWNLMNGAYLIDRIFYEFSVALWGLSVYHIYILHNTVVKFV